MQLNMHTVRKPPTAELIIFTEPDQTSYVFAGASSQTQEQDCSICTGNGNTG
ncbi:hypothetical protein ACP70R_037918 [Stipagrostis hirtigluma subsp. patula]